MGLVGVCRRDWRLVLICVVLEKAARVTINSCTCISIKKNVLHYQFQSYIHDEENLASTEARFFYAQNQEVNTK